MHTGVQGTLPKLNSVYKTNGRFSRFRCNEVIYCKKRDVMVLKNRSTNKTINYRMKLDAD